LIDFGQRIIEEPELLGDGKRVPLHDTSPATDFQLIVWYHYDTVIGHFFVELRPNVGEGEFFGKYPATKTNIVAEEMAREFFATGQKPPPYFRDSNNAQAIEDNVKEIASAVYGKGAVLSAKDRERFVRSANDKRGKVFPVEGSNRIKLTHDDYIILKKELHRRQADPRNYALVWDNCVTLVRDVLDSRLSVEDLFPLEVRIKSLAGVYVMVTGDTE